MLKENAVIAVIAPAGVPDMARVESGMALLRSWGYRTVEGRHLRAVFRYNAGTVQQRSEDLCWALSDPGIDAVWLARGGYGCAQCLPSLPDNLPRDRPVLGFSDATALFCALYQRGHGNLIHGPMVGFLGSESDDLSRQSVHALLTGGARVVLAGEHACGPRDSVSAPLIGGNLAVLASIAGTPWALSGKGAIVLLEEVTELAYRIDRTIVQLLASGFFDGVKGIALGEFIRCPLPEGSDFTIRQMMLELLEPLGVPVISGVGVGHGTRNLAWLVGEQVTMQGGSIHFNPAAN